jgi:hypothetical protein
MITPNNILAVTVATVGLKGIWGMEQLDKTGLATWKLGLILMGVAAPVCYALSMLMIAMEPNPIIGPLSQDAITAWTFWMVFIGPAMAVFFLALARAIEVDLKILASFDDAIDASIEKLRPKRALLIPLLIIGLLYGFLMFPALHSTVPQNDRTLVEAFIAYAAGGPHMIQGFILMPITGLIQGMGFIVIVRQIVSLIHAARHIKIDFLQLSDYAAIANQGVRIFLFSIPFLGLMPLLMLYEGDPENTAFIMRQSLIMVFVALIMILPYVYPVWILRNRIRDKKIAEMDQITLALRGDKEAVKTIVIQGLGTPTTTADLLTHQMFLESRWDWPIASHLQKLVLFGLLPPLAWVLAAMIENAMY